MRSKSFLPRSVVGLSITAAAPSKSSLLRSAVGFPFAPSTSCAIAHFSSSTSLHKLSEANFTACALSQKGFTFVGLARYCCAKSANIASFSRSAFEVVRVKLSPTRSNPLSTSVDTLSANIAISTTYIRLIIFCRGDTGRFFTDIVG